MERWKLQAAGAVLIAVMAIALGVAASRLPRRNLSHPYAAATAFPIASHTCLPSDATGDNTGLTQRADGSFSACLRVGALAEGSYQVTARRLGKGGPSIGTINPVGDWITLKPSSGPPGTTIRVDGYVTGLSADQRRTDEHVQLCWAACDALVGSVAVDWSTTELGRFTTQFAAPAAPWFNGKGVTPLHAGRYAVIVPCLAGIEKPSGSCPDATLEAAFDLTGQGSNLCVGSGACAALRSTPTQGPPGTLAAVDGWAPLTGLNGDGFLTVAIEGQLQSKPGFADATPLVASAPFTVTPAPPWSSLPALRPVSIQRTGMDAIGVDPGNASRFGYCAYGVVDLTSNGGRSWTSISLDGAGTASAATNYPIPNPYSGATRPTCDALFLDAKYPGTIYAVFDAVPRNGSPPPFYFVGYLTRDAGRSWQPVPVPDGSEMGMFGGFRVDSSSAQALFWKSDSTTFGPSAFIVQETLDGGRSWHTGTLRCPATGPCIALGPQDNGRCQAVGEWEGVLISTNSGGSWSVSGWPSRLGACATSELIGFGTGMAALDGGSLYPLILSSDSRVAWKAIALPPIPGQSPDGGCCQTLTMLPDGRLLEVADTWYVLNAGAVQWCRATNAPGTPNSASAPTPDVIGDRLWWIDTTRNGPGPYRSTPRSIAISAIHC